MEKLTNYQRGLLEYLFSEAATMLTDTLLETCADQEYRICLLELGITL